MSRKSALTKKVTESDGWQRAPSRDSDPGRGRPICHRGVITLFAVSYEQRICFACHLVTGKQGSQILLCVDRNQLT